MNTDENNQASGTGSNEGATEGETLTSEQIAELKARADKAEQLEKDLGSTKRELKKAQKAAEQKLSETEDNNSPSENNVLLEKINNLALRAAGITDRDEIDLAKKLQKETGKDIDDLLESKYFKSELEDLRTDKANTEATSGVKGDKGGGSTEAKNTTAYWQAKGQPPTPDDIPDAKIRRKIVREMVAANKSGGKQFYND